MRSGISSPTRFNLQANKATAITTLTDMKSTILIQLIALPAILASNIVELVIVAKEDLDAPQVIGRMDPSQNMTRMTSTSREIPHELLCLGDDEMWTHWGCDAEDNDKGRPLYRQIAQFNFAEFTKDPRPFIVMTDSSRPEHLRMVSHSCLVPGQTNFAVQYHCDKRG